MGDGKEVGWLTVSCGDYPGYQVNCIFDKKEDAENWAKIYGGFTKSVPKNPKALTAPDGLTRFSITIYPSGAKMPFLVERQETFRVDVDPFGTVVIRYAWKDCRPSWKVYLWAEDERHAISAAEEIRLQLITGTYDESKILDWWELQNKANRFAP